MADDIAKLGIEVDSSQVTAAADSLNRLATAANKVTSALAPLSTASKQTATATQQAATNTTSLATATQQAATATNQVAAAQGAAAKSHATATTSLAQTTNQTKLARYEMINLSRQIQDIGVSLQAGQSPFTVLVQQGTQIGDIFASSQATFSGFARQILSLITPMRVLVGVVGLVAGAGYILYQNWKQAEMQLLTLSERLDTSTNALRGLSNAASFKGIDPTEFTKGMEGFGDQVNIAKKGLGDLAELMRVNGQTSKGLEDSLFKVADLVRNAASGADKYRIAQAAGIPATAEWVRFLSQGGDVIRQQQQDALKFTDANDVMIRKAREFDEAWNKAWTNFSQNVRSSFVTATTFLSGLIDKAGEFLTRMQLAFRTESELGRQALGAGIGTQLTNQQAQTFYDVTGADRVASATTKIASDLSAINALERQHIQLLGDLASVEDRVKLKQLEIDEAIQKGVRFRDGEVAKLLEIARLQAIAADAATRIGALGEAATAAEKYSAALDDLKVKLASAKISQDDFNRAALALNPALIQIKGAITQIGDGLAQAFVRGANAADALHASLQAVASTAASSAINNLIKGDFASAGVSAGISLVSFLGSRLFGGSSSQDQAAQQQAAAKAEQDRVAREKTIADAQIRAAEYTLRAADAMAKVDFAKTLRDFDAESQKAFDAELKLAGDLAIWQLVAARTAERAALIANAIQTATATISGDSLNELQKRLQDMQNAATDLATALVASGVAAEDAASVVQQQMTTSLLGLADLTLGLNQPLSEMQDTVQKLISDASDLTNALIAAGMSAADAATAIGGKLAVALDQLTNKFLNDLIRKVNDLAGGSFINQGQDLFNEVQKLRADAAALGIATSLIDEYYVLSAQKIIDQNQLVGDQFNALVNMLGLGTSGLHEYADAVDSVTKIVTRSAQEIASTIQGYQDQLFTLQQDQTTLGGKLAVFDLQAQREREAEIAKGGQAIVALEALQQAQRAKIISDWNAAQLELQKQAIEAQKKAIEDQISATEDAIREQQKIIDNAKKIWEAAVKVVEDARRTIQNFVSGFLGSTQSFLSPQQQMNTAVATFQQQLALAKSGDQDALKGITGTAQSALDAIKGYYGSTAQGATLQQQILDQLSGLPGQLDPNQMIVDAIDKQTLAQAAQAQDQITKLQAQLTAQQAQLSALNTTNSGIASVNTQVTGVNTQVTGVNTDTNALSPIDTSTSKAATSLLALAQISSNTATTANVVNQHTGYLSTIATNTTAIRGALNYQSQWWGVQTLTPLPSFQRGGIVANDNSSGAVPIMAHVGEMIMNRAASAQYRGTLERMNTGSGDDDVVSELKSTQQLLINIAKAIVSEQRTGANQIVDQLTQVVEHSRSQARAARRKEVQVA